MAGLKKARKLAQELAAQKAAKQAQPTQHYSNRALAPEQAPQTQPTNPWLMTTADMPSEKDAL